MSAKPEIQDDQVTIEVDGVPLKARKGEMVIQVTDEAGIYIPRFCYHKKLGIAANCRMCLVEVEKSPKPMPACATPVADGMKVLTRSPKARAAQKGVMEFLLINHPLDCPICDQGGECELQDLALGYGRDVSRFTERKRVVKDKDIGPLISTEMTRCIHCTRCIRVLEEVGGVKELGLTGRGEHTEVGTFIERNVNSEMSGNVIDVCPVGALTNKPYRFTARAWEMIQHVSVAPHDGVGSNIYLHTLKGRVKRVVPRENEAVNEMWISDRDRYSYEGLYSDDRLTAPMVREDGEWKEVEWDTALEAVAGRLRGVLDQHGAEQLGALISPTATLEEMALLTRMLRGLGVTSIDHRLRQRDFRDQNEAPIFPWLGQTIGTMEKMDAVLLVGSNLRTEQPILAHRIRKAVRGGGRLLAINPVDYEFNTTVAAKAIVAPSAMPAALAGVVKAAAELSDKPVPEGVGKLVDALVKDVTPEQRALADGLREGESKTVLLGNLATTHVDFSVLRSLAAALCELTGSVLGYLPESGNTVGAWLTGVVPHREAAGKAAAKTGLDATAMLTEPRRAYWLWGVEPDQDCHDPALARQALDAAELVVACSAYVTDELKATADVLLPIAAFAETEGTFVNAECRWQSFDKAGAAPGDARPGWRVLRMLGSLLQVPGFEFDSIEALHGELAETLTGIRPDNATAWSRSPATPDAPAGEGLERIAEVPMYAVDAVVRRARSLQQTEAAQVEYVRLAPADAERLGLAQGDRVVVTQDSAERELPLVIDGRIAEGAAWLAAGVADTGPAQGLVSVRKA